MTKGNKYRPEGEHKSIEAYNNPADEGITFVANGDGEVRSFEDGWGEIGTISKGRARKMMSDFVRGTAEAWVEAAGAAGEAERLVNEVLPGLIDKLLPGRIERLAGEILEEMLREKVREHLASNVKFEIRVSVTND
jgi:hypothetical protein